jgi:hypothetical protein
VTATAYTLAAVLDVFILLVGARFLLQPRPAAAGYGVPAQSDGDPAYLAIKGLRDAVFGILGLTLLAFADTHAEACFMLVAALVPLGDTLIVLRYGGARATAFGVHFATAIVVLISAGLLFAA